MRIKLLLSLLCFSVLINIYPIIGSAFEQSDQFTIVYEDKVLLSDVAPVVEEDVIYIPLRVVAEALGTKISWFEELQTAKVETPAVTYEFCLLQDVIRQGTEILYQQPGVQKLQDRIMVSSAVMADLFQIDVVLRGHELYLNPSDKFEVIPYEYKDDIYTEDGSVLLDHEAGSLPQIKNIWGLEPVASINEEILLNHGRAKWQLKEAKEYEDSYAEDLRQDYQRYPEQFYPSSYEAYLDKAYISGNLVSFLVKKSGDYKGDKSQYYVAFNYNLETGKPVMLSDIFSCTYTEVAKRVLTLFQEKIKEAPDFYFNNAKELISNSFRAVPKEIGTAYFKYYFSEDGIIFYFDPGEISDMQNGKVEVLLSYSDCQDILSIKPSEVQIPDENRYAREVTIKTEDEYLRNLILDYLDLLSLKESSYQIKDIKMYNTLHKANGKEYNYDYTYFWAVIDLNTVDFEGLKALRAQGSKLKNQETAQKDSLVLQYNMKDIEAFEWYSAFIGHNVGTTSTILAYQEDLGNGRSKVIIKSSIPEIIF